MASGCIDAPPLGPNDRALVRERRLRLVLAVEETGAIEDGLSALLARAVLHGLYEADAAEVLGGETGDLIRAIAGQRPARTAD